MGRADMPLEERRPFYLYVDEFQNFATDSFATILSEARKYGLNLTVANQYISQMSDPVRSAVFGNVGTIVCFRISPDDAPFLQKYFEPQFEAPDLIQQHSRFFVTTMMIGDEKAPAFSAKTLNLPVAPDSLIARIVALSRERYAQERTVVEDLVRKNGLAIDQPADEKPAPQPAKPHTQAQVQRLDEIATQESRNKPVKLGGLLQQIPADAQEPSAPKKRRRGKRGGKKNRSTTQTNHPAVVQPEQQGGGHEQVIHLR
jgi:hypothetical protein